MAVTGELTVTVAIGSPFPPWFKKWINKQCMFFSILWHEGAKASKDSRWVTPLLQDGGVRLDTWCTEHGDADADGETRLVGLATAG